MRTLTKWLSRPCALGALLLALAAAPACTLHGRTTGVWRVDSEPPPPRPVVPVYRAGFVWVDGNWEYVHGRWMWRDGYYVRARPDRIYVQGNWYSDGGGWRWRPGYWDRRVVRQPRRHVQDHRPR